MAKLSCGCEPLDELQAKFDGRDNRRHDQWAFRIYLDKRSAVLDAAQRHLDDRHVRWLQIQADDAEAHYKQTMRSWIYSSFGTQVAP